MARGSFSIHRQKKQPQRWKVPGVVEYLPFWYGRFRLPDSSEKNLSTEYELCPQCLQVAEDANPTKERPACRCQRPAREYCEKYLKAAKRLYLDGRMAALDAVGLKRTVVSIGKIMDVYRENVPASMTKGLTKNLNALEAFLEQSTGKQGQALKDLPVSVLTKPLGLDWMRMRQAYNAEMDLPAGERRSWSELRAALERPKGLPGLVLDEALPGNATINSMLRMVKAVVGEKSRAFYLRGLELPDLTGFHAIPSLPAEHGHKPLAQDQVAALEREAQGWRENYEDLWVAYHLASRLGLRQAEILAARRSWMEFDVDAGRWLLVVKNRKEEEFRLKGKNKAQVRRLELSDELSAVLLKRQDLLVAPGELKWVRFNLVARDLSKAVAAYFPDREKTVHELRKHFGSVVYTNRGKEAATAALGHAAGSKVTEAYYATHLGTVPMVSDDDLAGRKAG